MLSSLLIGHKYFLVLDPWLFYIPDEACQAFEIWVIQLLHKHLLTNVSNFFCKFLSYEIGVFFYKGQNFVKNQLVPLSGK